jgi:hypothetical protein
MLRKIVATKNDRTKNFFSSFVAVIGSGMGKNPGPQHCYQHTAVSYFTFSNFFFRL